MKINTYNSFFISALIHSLFAGALFIALPKQDYRVNPPVDISFLFPEIENEAQKHQTSTKKPLLKNEKPTAYLETPARTEDRYPMTAPVIEPNNYPSKTESLSSHESVTAAWISEGHLQAVSPDDKFTGAVSGYVKSEVNKGHASIPPSSIGSKPQASSSFSYGDTDKSAIIRAFVERIESLKYYPYIARRKGIEGTVIILAHLDKEGELKEATLKASSGYEILDMKAVELIKKACPFRHGYNSDLKIEIPITYRLIR